MNVGLGDQVRGVRRRKRGMDATLSAELHRRGLTARPASSTAWLTTRGHLNPVVRREAPDEVIDALDEVHAALGGDRRSLSHLPDTPLRPSLAFGGQHVVVDDVGHLTSDRLVSLDHYPTTSMLGFSLDAYRQLIEAWRQRAAAALSRRWSPDFDFVGGRRARRAYEDAVRDLLTPVFTGLPLLRVASPDDDAVGVADSLGLRLATIR